MMTEITLHAATVPAPRKVLGDKAVIHLVNTQHMHSVTFISVNEVPGLRELMFQWWETEEANKQGNV